MKIIFKESKSYGDLICKIHRGMIELTIAVEKKCGHNHIIGGEK